MLSTNVRDDGYAKVVVVVVVVVFVVIVIVVVIVVVDSFQEKP